MIYIGIDPGKKGAYAWYTDGVMRVRQWDDNYFAQDMHLLAAMDDRLVACVEKVGAMPGQGTVSMFSFGQSFGFILGVLTAFGIPYQLVPPRKWKAEYGLLNTQKQASVDVAKRLFPEVSFLPTERCRKESDGMSDAVLMAEYARRKF